MGLCTSFLWALIGNVDGDFHKSECDKPGFYSFPQENSKKLKMKFPPKIPNRKTKSKTNKGGITQPNINDSLEITKLDSSIISEGKISTITPQIQAFNLQKAAAGLFIKLTVLPVFLLYFILILIKFLHALLFLD